MLARGRAFYLRQRAEDADGPDTARLVNYTNKLDANKYTEISNWKLKIAGTGTVDITVSGAGTLQKSQHRLLGTSTTRRGRRDG
jgi:hypothetical protein